MCVYNGRRVSRAEYDRLMAMERALRSLQQNDIPVQYAYDYRSWPIIKRTPQGSSCDLHMAHWEYLPPVLPSAEYHLKFRANYDTVNSRGEKILQSSLFRPGAINGRCLIISSHFFEHRHLDQYGKKGQLLKEKRKIPYCVTLPDHDVFWMAGISQRTFDVESGEEKETFSIVTTDATENKLMSQVHNSKMRMATVLPQPLAEEWLLGNLTETRIRELATHVYPSEEMHAHTVKKGFWNEHDPMQPFYYNDVPQLIS